MMFTEGYVLGGAENTPSLAFGEAPLPMFDDPPGCWLHHQATFINAFFPGGTEAGVDYDWFPTPPIDEDNKLFAGELAMVFRNRPEVVDFLERFSSVPVQCAHGRARSRSAGSRRTSTSGRSATRTRSWPSASTILAEALATGTGRLRRRRDQMPPEVGAGCFWTGMVEYMQQGPDSLQAVLDDIEASWPAE